MSGGTGHAGDAGETREGRQLLRRGYRRVRRALRRAMGLQDDRIAVIERRLDRIRARAEADRRKRVADRRATRQRIRALEGEVSPSGILTRRIDELAEITERLNQDLQRLDAEQQATPFVAPGITVRSTSEDGTEILRLGAEDGSRYADFEDAYRGSESFVRDRLSSYLEIVTEGPVLDVGCGRGEFVELLSSAGVPARGIDLDKSMVERAQSNGLDVVHGDALLELDGMEPGSLAAVTSFQVIEHIDVAALREFFLSSRRALRPGGLMVAETVNPHSPAALKTFWLDLTHVRPLFPESLLFLARECGFEEAWIHFPMGTGELDRDLRQCGEYALVARKERDSG